MAAPIATTSVAAPPPDEGPGPAPAPIGLRDGLAEPVAFVDAVEPLGLAAPAVEIFGPDPGCDDAPVAAETGAAGETVAVEAGAIAVSIVEIA